MTLGQRVIALAILGGYGLSRTICSLISNVFINSARLVHFLSFLGKLSELPHQQSSYCDTCLKNRNYCTCATAGQRGKKVSMDASKIFRIFGHNFLNNITCKHHPMVFLPVSNTLYGIFKTRRTPPACIKSLVSTKH